MKNFLIKIFFFILVFSQGFAESTTNVAGVSGNNIGSEKLENMGDIQVIKPDLLSSSQNINITLKQLIAEEDFIIRGIGASRELYLPILPSWQVNQLKLNLKVKRDNVTARPIQLTAFINGYPVSSITLNVSDQSQDWQIDIPSKWLKGPTINLVFKRMLNEEGYGCNNLYDPDSWIVFSGDSSINYLYQEAPYQSLLTRFPEPFINPLGIKEDKVLLIVPDSKNNNNLSALYYVASGLFDHQTWRGITINTSTISQVTKEDQESLAMIAIGKSKDLIKLVDQNFWTVPLNANGELLDEKGAVLSEKTGVVMIIPSPKNKYLPLLLVTGNSEEAVVKAASQLRDKNFGRSVLSNQYILVNTFKEVMVKNIDWSNVTFSDLGYEDSVIYGGSDGHIKYDINLPNNRDPEGMDIVLQYKLSPLLSSIFQTYIAVGMNNFPISAKKFNIDVNDVNTFSFHIDADNLVSGTNKLDFLFDLKYKQSNCTRSDLSAVWAIIYKNSTLKVKFKDDDLSLTFAQFYELNNNLNLIYEDNDTIFPYKDLIKLMVFVAKTMPSISQVKVYSSAENNEVVEKENYIYLGDLNKSRLLVSLKNNLPFNFIDNKLEVNMALRPYFHVSFDDPLAVAQLVKINEDKNYLLLLTGINLSGYEKGIEILFNPRKNNYLRANAALIFADGTFSSIDTNKLEQKAINVKAVSDIRRDVFLGFGVFGTIFFGGIFLVMLVRRLKWYFSKHK